MTMIAPAPAPSGTSSPRLLIVDDDPAVLEALALNLRRSFEVVTATSGADGLEYLQAESDFAVVVSDMRMPKMDGATFLAQAREVAPDAVRILLTGQADLDAAIKAVNQGQIFRFLTKPCPRDTLRGAIESAVQHHRLQTGERVLLEQTLRGSIKMLIDVLAITSPAAFGRANQIKTRVLQLARLLGILDSWQLEIAALASQLGHIVLPHELCEKIEARLPLTDDEQRMVARASVMTEQLLANILPATIAERLKDPSRNIIADKYDDASILFADIAGYTKRASDTSPTELVQFLDTLYTDLDALVDKHGLEKIKTSGDSYMVVSGVPRPRHDHVQAIACLALDMADAVADLKDPQGRAVPLRIGMASGPVVAGVVGARKFFYDVWGDAVNVASRMESTDVEGRIQVPQRVYESLKDDYVLEERGLVDVKGKGPMNTWYLVGRRNGDHPTNGGLESVSPRTTAQSV